MRETITNRVTTAVSAVAGVTSVQVVLDVKKRVRVLKGGGLGSRAQSRLGSFVVEYAALARRGTILGIVLAVTVVIITFLMVVKPPLWSA